MPEDLILEEKKALLEQAIENGKEEEALETERPLFGDVGEILEDDWILIMIFIENI